MQVPRWHRNPWCCAALHSFTNTFEATSFSYWFDKPWFHTEGKLAATLIIPSSWGSQLTCDVQALFLALLPRRYSLVNLEPPTRFLAPLPGRTNCFCGGSLSHPISLLCYLSCLVYFYLVLFALFIKNTKKLVTCLFQFCFVSCHHHVLFHACCYVT